MICKCKHVAPTLQGSHVTILQLVTCIQLLSHRNKAGRTAMLLRMIAALTQQGHGGMGGGAGGGAQGGDWQISERLAEALSCFFLSLMSKL